MSRTAATLCATISMAGLAIVLGDAFSAARADHAGGLGLTDISAAQRGGGGVSRSAPRPARVNVVRSAPRVARAPRTNVARTARVKTVRTPRVRTNVSRVPKTGVSNVSRVPGTVKTGNKLGPAAGGALSAAKLQHGPGKVGPIGPKPNASFVKLANNKVAPIWKGPKKIWWGGGWKTFLPYTALGVFVIGGAYYYPDGYLSLAGPYCAGITPDGCRLRWQLVGFEDGGEDWQCVEYCRRPGAMPPPQAVAYTEPPPPPQGRCEVVIYPEPTFGGTGVPTSEEQPQLSQSGWQNQIASIQVRAGTWDFYSGEQYTGEQMRLPPGPYPTLGPDWTKRIGSFMCVQPGA
jgi:Beta/Gamma crystallin